MQIAVFSQVHSTKFDPLREILLRPLSLLLIFYGGVKEKLDALLPAAIDVAFLQHEWRIIVKAFWSQLAVLVGHLTLWVEPFQFWVGTKSELLAFLELVYEQLEGVISTKDLVLFQHCSLNTLAQDFELLVIVYWKIESKIREIFTFWWSWPIFP